MSISKASNNNNNNSKNNNEFKDDATAEDDEENNSSKQQQQQPIRRSKSYEKFREIGRAISARHRNLKKVVKK